MASDGFMAYAPKRRIAAMQWFFTCTLLVSAFASCPAIAGALEDLIRTGVLPQNPQKPLSVTPLLDRVKDGSTATSVFLLHRKAHTRTPIHSHDSGGITCLIQGEMTLFVEGQRPLRIETPGCFYMPSGKKMIGYNSGNKTAVLYDIFEGQTDFQHWSVHEHQQKSPFQNQFGD